MYIVTVWAGLTICFFLPRLVPIDPITVILSRVTAMGAFMDPETYTAMRKTLLQLFGLEGSLQEQYFSFLSKAIIGEFGISIAVFPSKVNDLIYRALPWTISLLATTTLFSWIFGNIVGLLVGYYRDKKISKVFQLFAIAVYPIPYYVLALIFVFVFCYTLRVFPLFGSKGIGFKVSFSLEFLSSLIFHSFLPALTLFIVNLGWWILSMRALTVNLSEEDFVKFAEIKGMEKKVILSRYIFRNALLPQITQLTMALSTIFSGAVLTEFIFSYPGLGQLLYMAVSSSDIYLLMGITSLSVIAVSTSALIIDLIYPLFDPRIKYEEKHI
ncbi:MAG: ABC transporter permease [Candidatus Bathyarchaeia archaeon]